MGHQRCRGSPLDGQNINIIGSSIPGIGWSIAAWVSGIDGEQVGRIFVT